MLLHEYNDEKKRRTQNMPRRILILLAVFSMLLAGCYANAFAEALPAEEEDDYGLIPSGRIEIPDYTQ